ESIREQAMYLFKRYIADTANIWAIEKIRWVTFEEPDANTIRVSITFDYIYWGQHHDGLIQINFTDQGFRAGWFRHYDAPSLGLYGYKGWFGEGLQNRVREVFQDGLNVRQSTLDVPSYVAEQARLKFENEIIRWGRFTNDFNIQRVESMESEWL